MPQCRLLVCIVGMPGSGKSIVSSIASEMGIPVLVMGDIVRNEASRLGLELTPENLNYVARMLREKHGPAAIALLMADELAQLMDEGHKVVVIDGVRSMKEIEVFRAKCRCEVAVIAVHSSPRTRFERLKRRGRPGDPKTYEEFVKRDYMELSFGIGEVIALADYMIVNEGGLEEARREARRILSKLVESCGKGKS